MEPNYYQSYITEYKAAIELLQKRKQVQQQKVKLEEEMKEKLVHLKEQMNKITKAKSRQMELSQLEETIKSKTKNIEQTSEEIELQRRRCHNKQMNIMHLHKVINEFRKQFSDDLKFTVKKYQDLNLLEIKYSSRQRAMLFELGSFLFNETIAGHIYNGIYQLIKDHHENAKNKNKIGSKTLSIIEVDLSPANQEAEISTALGHLVLLLNAISKYSNVPLKFPMYFCGSQSVIMGKLHENYPLYISRVYDKSKFNIGFRHLFQNMMQIFEYHEVDLSDRKAKLRKGMEILIKLLQGNHTQH